MVLLDGPDDWSGEAKVVAHWSRLQVSFYQYSIPLLTEENSLSIKKEFLEWADALGQWKIDGKPLKTRLQISKDFSLWPSVWAAIKSPYISESIYDVFKLRVLEKFYAGSHCKGLIYCGASPQLDRTLNEWMQRLEQPYRRAPCPAPQKTSSNGSLRDWVKRGPHWFQALAFLSKRVYFFLPNSKASADPKFSADDKRRITIVAFFPNIDKNETRRGRFRSKYWEKLHPVLDELPVAVDWVWHYFSNKEISRREMAKLRNACNKSAPQKYRHYLVEQFLGPGLLFKILKNYFRAYRLKSRLKKASIAFRLSNSQINFFPTLQEKWESSLRGYLAMNALISFAGFENLAQTIPKSSLLLYVWENQPWDTSLLQTWRKLRPETKIVGYQHFSSIRPLHLNLFSQTNNSGGPERPSDLAPDRLAINSASGLKLMKESGVAEEILTPVEGLAYYRLKGQFGKLRGKQSAARKTLLVVTGVLKPDNQFQFELLNGAAKIGALDLYEKILLKEHPALPTDELIDALATSFEFERTDRPLEELFQESDAVYCANATGASLEASWLGLPVIITAAANALNMNPFFGWEGVSFVSDSSTLRDQLLNPPRINIPEDYYFLDDNLGRWKSLLNQYADLDAF